MIVMRIQRGDLPLTCLFALSVLLTDLVAQGQTGTVAISNPLDGQRFPVGGKLAVTVRPQVTGGAITNVEFYLIRSGAPEAKLGDDTEAPFSVPWEMNVAGDFTLRAVARGNQGARIDSTPVRVTVFPPKTLTRTESFDSSLGTFTLELNNTTEPAVFGFSNTRNAGGQPGELGGVVVRSTSGAPTAVGRMDLGGDFLLARNDLFIKGKFLLRQQDFDGWLGIGFIATDGASFSGEIVGLGLNEPGGGFAPNFRGFGRAYGASGPTFGIPLNVVNEFCLFWSGKDKTLRGTVAGQAISVSNPGVSANAQVNAVFAGSFNVGSPSAQACELYVDDFTYSLWEPPSLIDVAITAPSPYAAYPPGSTLTLSAEATEEGGTIAKVEFFALSNTATNKVGEASTAPYSAQWTVAAAGEYRIQAVATTAAGKTERSIEVPMSIVAPSRTQTIRESFAANLGSFDILVRNQYLDGDFGWRDSNNAAGEAGEFGGAFPGVGFGDAAYIGSGLGALLLPSQQSLTLAGKMVMLPPPNSAQQVFVGYVNTADLTYEHDFGLVFEADEQTVILRFPGATLDPVALPIDQPFAFDLTWNVLQKKLMGTVADMPIDVTVDAVTPVAFNALVMGAFGPNGTSRDNVSWCYLDDLSFTRAEPDATPPILVIARQGNSVTLGWQGTGFRIQERPSLSGGAWSDSSAPVVSVGDRHTATIVPEGAARFYRLAR
jgi:hypothetical protein